MTVQKGKASVIGALKGVGIGDTRLWGPLYAYYLLYLRMYIE